MLFTRRQLVCKASTALRTPGRTRHKCLPPRSRLGRRLRANRSLTFPNPFVAGCTALISTVSTSAGAVGISRGSPFEVTSPVPPLPFSDGFFELVYGHSVFTHLGKQDQHAWLLELVRVTQPGGYCLVTVLNEVSWFLRYYPNRRTPQSVAEFMETGFVDVGEPGCRGGQCKTRCLPQCVAHHVLYPATVVESILRLFR